MRRDQEQVFTVVGLGLQGSDPGASAHLSTLIQVTHSGLCTKTVIRRGLGKGEKGDECVVYWEGSELS